LLWLPRLSLQCHWLRKAPLLKLILPHLLSGNCPL
jgi:hypothetical protein